MINLNNYSRKPLYKDIPLLEINYKGKFWYLNGERHRLDGPAIEYADGTCYTHYGKKRWWVNGNQLLERQFNELLKVNYKVTQDD